MKIKSARTLMVQNSRGQDTIEVRINKKHRSAAPSGASTGSSEVKSYPDKGIEYAIDFLNEFKDIKSMKFDEFEDLGQLDSLIPIVGGNSVIALQFAILKAMSEERIWEFLNPKSKKLPVPLGNVIGGGAHTDKASNDIQEFLLMPKAKSFYDSAFVNNYLHKKMQKETKAKYMTDEGAWITGLSNIEVMKLLFDYLADESKTLGIKVGFGMDMAATSFWKSKYYHYKNFSAKVKERKLGPNQQIDFVNEIIEQYGLKYVEDPLQENDFIGFSKLSKKTLICGDDLVTTNLDRLKEAVRHDSVNCIIVKPNQIGSIIKTKEVVDFAHRNNIKMVISHRSGETYDATISHLAVAWNIPYIKCGIFGKERKAKIDELIKIEKEIE